MATLTSKNQFIGFSTVNSIKSNTLVDVAIVNQDLLNHFNTRSNERVMRPNWGCGVWNYLFEPFDSSTKSLVTNEVLKIINADPRVQLQNMTITTFENGIRIVIDLYYVPWKAFGTFTVNFDKRNQTLS